MGRVFGRLFRERQIYHRADGVVRFVKLSSRTQLVMAVVMGASLLWVAYSSVNVVFKEQIIVSKDQERRDQEAAYRRRLQTAETAYDQVNALNYIYAREFDATITGLKGQHDALRSLVENKSAIDRRIEALSETLSATGAPGGKQSDSTNRLMIDPVGREPTPRQSRISALRDDALRGILEQRVAEGIDDEVLADMRSETADLSARQVVLMASLEEDMRKSIREMAEILQHTGIDVATIVDGYRLAAVTPDPSAEDYTGQGGPLIPVTSVASSTTYFKSAARIDEIMTEMRTLNTAIENLPLSNPIAVRHRMSSTFGWRWDPVQKTKRAPHKGLDFAAPRNSPVLATGKGRVSFAGVRGGFGRTVEIDHGNGLKTRYGHLNKINVRAGQEVNMLDVIGLLGSTGRSTGNHVHYEVLFKGRQVDPLKFIEAGRYVFES
ncbi:peptidoglycan DD-metalloendopeptidase family protein [Parvularcula sp. LCG005]|uniref:peptidoglycan DD-metalloendopeptidase family protein n=1 Tax=Parvularcula sp. LCG005 TaxID=3078805 RepID=UPI002942FDE3|nr:peptidoglycan DD-metalloendopeptidase family protein [Parvularcula sp. LCG005]WOI54109.1 peptidoglycan DD-metalloendopeptidase family protein [Parvularcula sp. LCG005]